MSARDPSAASAPPPGGRPGPRQGGLAGGLLGWLVAAAIIAFVALSLAHILLIPPGEGFDEMAHYSYISQLADEGRIPVIGQDSIDASWEQRRERFPEPYGALGPTMTYQRFFEQPHDVRREAILTWYGPPDAPIRYQQSLRPNWQGQHPPLYYALMVPVYKLAAGLSIGHRLLWLRLASVIVACSSVVFFWLAWRAARTEIQRWLTLGVALAALTPALFSDIARVGNDSLCMALGAALFWQLLGLRHARRPWLTVAIVGLLLGLGCLTKAFFLALAPGALVTVVLVSRRAGWRTVLGRCALVAVVCIAIAAWWHLRSYRTYGVLIPIQDLLGDREPAGAHLGPLEHLWRLVRGIVPMGVTYAYSGTWSWVRLAAAWYVPFGALFVLIAVTFVLRLKTTFLRWPDAALLIPLIPLGAGFLWRLNLIIHIKGAGTVSGYFLHAFWPFMALLVGGALVQLKRYWMRALVAALFVGCFVSCRVGELTQLLIYGGIGTKSPQGFLSVPDGTGFSGVGTALHNLGELVPLNAGLGFYTLGVAAQIVVVVLVARWLLRQRGPDDLVSSLDV